MAGWRLVRPSPQGEGGSAFRVPISALIFPSSHAKINIRPAACRLSNIRLLG